MSHALIDRVFPLKKKWLERCLFPFGVQFESFFLVSRLSETIVCGFSGVAWPLQNQHVLPALVLRE